MVDTSLRFAVFLTFLAVSLAAKQGVPLFMWSNDKLDVPSPVSGHTTTREEFNQGYMPSLLGKQQNIVAFLQDNLSIDDITQHADVYNDKSDGAALHNLKGLLEEHSSTQLPAVRSIPEIIKKLRREFPGKVHELSHPYQIGDLSLDESANLIIAKLPQAGVGGAQLKNNDNVMKSVSDELKAMDKPFTAIFTGEQPTPPPSNAVYTGRHLLQDGDSGSDIPAGASFLNVSGYLYFFTTQVEVTLTKLNDQRPIGTPIGYTKFLLPPSNKAASGSVAGQDSGLLKISYTGVKPNTTDVKDGDMNIDLSFGFEIGSGPIWSGFWRISEFNVTYSVKNDSGEWKGDNVPLRGADIYAPFSTSYSFCYHCTKTGAYSQNRTDVNYYIRVNFQDLQVQYATENIPIKDEKFGRPNDCTGFFTIPILSGLFAGLILILVLFYGLSMISSITTMDRFDDPKGKSISVNVSE